MLLLSYILHSVLFNFLIIKCEEEAISFFNGTSTITEQIIHNFSMCWLTNFVIDSSYILMFYTTSLLPHNYLSRFLISFLFFFFFLSFWILLRITVRCNTMIIFFSFYCLQVFRSFFWMNGFKKIQKEKSKIIEETELSNVLLPCCSNYFISSQYIPHFAIYFWTA